MNAVFLRQNLLYKKQFKFWNMWIILISYEEKREREDKLLSAVWPACKKFLHYLV